MVVWAPEESMETFENISSRGSTGIARNSIWPLVPWHWIRFQLHPLKNLYNSEKTTKSHSTLGLRTFSVRNIQSISRTNLLQVSRLRFHGGGRIFLLKKWLSPFLKWDSETFSTNWFSDFHQDQFIWCIWLRLHRGGREITPWYWSTVTIDLHLMLYFSWHFFPYNFQYSYLWFLFLDFCHFGVILLIKFMSLSINWSGIFIVLCLWQTIFGTYKWFAHFFQVKSVCSVSQL